MFDELQNFYLKVQIIKYYKFNGSAIRNRGVKKMHSQIDKQNIIKNSKLEMSIKPFSLAREDLTKSKSQQKNRKGISRVNSSNKNHIQTYSQSHFSILSSTGPILIPSVVSYSTQGNAIFKSGQTKKKEGEEYKQLEINKKNECYSALPNNFSVIEQQSRERQMDLLSRIEQLEKQLIIVERQNGNCQGQKREWIKKCEQLCEANQNLFKKVSELTQQLILRKKCQDEKQQLVKNKQKYIEELLEKNKIQRDMTSQSYRKINQLNSQLQMLTRKLIQFQNKELNQGMHFRINSTQKIQQVRKQLSIQKEQLFNLREQNRQLLIKNSSLIQQRNKWQSKLNIVTYELQNEKQKYQTLQRKYEESQNQMEYLQKQAMFGRAYKKQAQQGSRVKQQLEYLINRNGEYETKIKQLEQRRLNQIQFHQEEIKRVQQIQADKYENIIEIYKNEKNQALQKVKQLTLSINSISNNHNEIIQNLNKQYENLVIQLKCRLQEQLERVNQFEIKFLDKQKQTAQLIMSLTSLKENNSFLINHVNEQKDRYASLSLILTEKQREFEKEIQRLKKKQKDNQIQIEINKRRERERQNPPNNELFQSFRTQLMVLENRNVEMSVKLGEYELQAAKLSDKIHILLIQAEKSRSRQDSYERKIKHLNEQLEHLQISKNKSMDEKIKIIEELQSLRMQQKSKQNQQKVKQRKLQEYDRKLQALEKKQRQQKEIFNQMTEKNRCLSVQVSNLTNQLVDARKELELQSQLSLNLAKQKSHWKKIQGQMLEKQKEIQKYKECLQFLKEQVAIGKQKARLTEQISEKLSQSDTYTERSRENRILMYKNIIMNLNPEQLNIVIDGNTWKLSEQEIISIVNKAARISGEYQNELEVRLNKIQTQYKELIEAEETTRALAQKYHEKTLQLQNLLIKMEEAHNKKIFLVKQDYDAVYNKYLKYRNMVIAQNKERERERERQREPSKDKFLKK